MAVETARVSRNGKGSALGPTSNDAAALVGLEEAYRVRVLIEGTAALLFHRWSNEAVEQKAKAPKNSAAKKTDDVESYVYRNDRGWICLPGEYVRMSLVGAARSIPDPRSPRKSAMELFKASIVPLTELAPIAKEWDYLHQARVNVQRSAVTRVRPCFLPGWKAEVDLEVLAPEYVSAELLLLALQKAGRFVGVGDFRPTYGRFQVTRFEVQT